MSLAKVKIGNAKNYVIKVKPVLVWSSILFAKKSTNTPGGTLDYNDNTYLIKIFVSRTSVVSNIDDAKLSWTFKPDGDNKAISIEHPEKVTLRKINQEFHIDSVKVPVETLFKDHADSVLHKKGTLSFSIIIDGMDPIEVSGSNLPKWNFSFDFTLKRNDSFTYNGFSQLKGKSFTIGDELEIVCKKGESIPDDFKAYLYIWENDVGSNFTSKYALKIKSDKTADIQLQSGNTKTDIQATSFVFGQSGSQIHYVGCDKSKNINCGNPEGASTNNFEFSAAILFTDNLKSTGAEYKLLKDFEYSKLIYSDIYDAPQPVIELSCIKRTESGFPAYFVRLTLKNLSTNLRSGKIEFMLLKKGNSSLYQWISTPPKRETKGYNNSFLEAVMVNEFEYLDENSTNYSWFWPENHFVKKPARLDFFEVKMGIKFGQTGWHKDYRVCINLSDFASRIDKENLTILFSGFKISKAISMMNAGNYGYSDDNAKKYKYIAFDFDKM